jgi:tryptophan synthase alpha chain
MRRFDHARSIGRAAFMPYVCCGDPTPAFTEKLIDVLCEAGADLIEFGIPFSDPVADGPTIQGAVGRALRNGLTVTAAFQTLERAKRAHPGVGFIVMTYYNLIHRRGLRAFTEALRTAGASGLIVPDLPLEESGPLRTIAERLGLAFVFLVAPRTQTARLRRMIGATRGFLYLVGVEGTTGARAQLAPSAVALVQRVRPLTTKPLALGFGISQRDHAAQAVAAGADGVITGSALINAYIQYQRAPSRALNAVSKLALELVRGCAEGFRGRS